MVEGLSEATNATFVDHKFSLSPLKVHFKWKKKYESFSPTVNLNIYYFSPNYLLVLARPTRPNWAVPERWPKSSTIDFAVKTFDCLLEKPLGVIARWPEGARSWTQTWTLPPDQWAVKILSALNPWINCVEVLNSFKVCWRYCNWCQHWVISNLLSQGCISTQRQGWGIKSLGDKQSRITMSAARP